MTLESFIEIHGKKSPVDKLHLLLKNADTLAMDKFHVAEAMGRGNVGEAKFWTKEVHHMEERIEWLAEEIETVLRLDGHVPENEKPPKPKPRRGCEDCPNFKMEQNVSGWEAKCTGRSKKGKILEWQYGLDMDWCRKQLMKSINNKMCPGWCPMLKKGESDVVQL